MGRKPTVFTERQRGMEMSRFSSLAFAGATGLVAALVPVSGAAMPLALASPFAGAGVLSIGVACNAYSCWNYGPRYSPVYRPYYAPLYSPYTRPYYWPAYRPYYRPSYNGPYRMPYYPPYRPFYIGEDSPYYRSTVPAYTARSAHVSYCLSRYRTYNPATNQYHAGGGIYRYCLSPYR